MGSAVDSAASDTPPEPAGHECMDKNVYSCPGSIFWLSRYLLLHVNHLHFVLLINHIETGSVVGTQDR